ncbi:MAG: YIP1 family protein [Kiritimatiellae bacterium]|nr:YIP1 family protein [Kiritimatiellia bacterium]
MTEEKTDYGLPIPGCDQEFVILPEKKKVHFKTTGALLDYLTAEITAWDSVDNSIRGHYWEVKQHIEKVIKGLGDAPLKAGMLNDAKKLLSTPTLNGVDINTCIDSNSNLGKKLFNLKKRCQSVDVYRRLASVAFRISQAQQVSEGAGELEGDLGLAWLVMDGILEDYEKSLKSLKEEEVRIKKTIASAKSLMDVAAKKTEQYSESQKNEFDKRLNYCQSALSAAFDKNTVRMNELEEIYNNKLQLEEPAQYWKKLADSYLNRGWVFMAVTFLSGATVFGWLMSLLLDAEFLPLFTHTQFDAATIRASLIFVMLMSVAGYVIHLFTRIAISSFHLARDYRERYQLTRVYLALLKDSNFKYKDDNARHIVFQAIFSRSDTGLLKGDHALTMPIANVGELVKGQGGK